MQFGRLMYNRTDINEAIDEPVRPTGQGPFADAVLLIIAHVVFAARRGNAEVL